MRDEDLVKVRNDAEQLEVINDELPTATSSFVTSLGCGKFRKPTEMTTPEVDRPARISRGGPGTVVESTPCSITFPCSTAPTASDRTLISENPTPSATIANTWCRKSAMAVTAERATVLSGTVTVPSGTVTVPSGTVTVPSGTVTVPSGTVTVPSGTVTVLSGTVTVPSGTVTVPSGTVTVPSGTVTVPSGTVTVPSGTVTVTSGTVTVPLGTTTVTYTEWTNEWSTTEWPTETYTEWYTVEPDDYTSDITVTVPGSTTSTMTDTIAIRGNDHYATRHPFTTMTRSIDTPLATLANCDSNCGCDSYRTVLSNAHNAADSSTRFVSDDVMTSSAGDNMKILIISLRLYTDDIFSRGALTTIACILVAAMGLVMWRKSSLWNSFMQAFYLGIVTGAVALWILHYEEAHATIRLSLAGLVVAMTSLIALHLQRDRVQD